MVDKYHGSAIAIYVEGILGSRTDAPVIVVIELTDVAFCIDGVSWTSWWTTCTCPRSSSVISWRRVSSGALYPQLAGTVELFPDLNYSVACVLVLVGVDMCFSRARHDLPPVPRARDGGALHPGHGVVGDARRLREGRGCRGGRRPRRSSATANIAHEVIRGPVGKCTPRLGGGALGSRG